MMTIFKSNFSLLIISILLLSGCAKDNACDGTACPVGLVLTEKDGNCFCVPDTDQADVITKTGLIITNETWTADNIYQLQGKTVVSEGATLTIEPGTIIKGMEGTGTLASALIVARGAKINAVGTEDNPIIFTSVLDNIEKGQQAGTNLDETQNGLWGGLIILGYAPCSFEADVNEFQIEGIPANESYGLYGGNNPTDNSGAITYVSIRHGGALIGGNNEINGLTLGGVGSGTLIENIEVIANQDDGIEFFGGTVNVSNALVWAQGDDAFDVDQAYSGTLDNFIYVAGADSDHGLEIDGPEGSATGSFTFKNGTLKGMDAEMADFRKSAEGTLEDCRFFGFPADADLEIDDNGSSANYWNGALVIKNNTFVTASTVADICHDKSDNADEAAFDNQMSIDNTADENGFTGADVSRYHWTFTATKGALSDF